MSPDTTTATPERAGREGDQPLPTRGGESVFAEMHRRLDAREAIGIKRYGRSLETFNGRDAGRDLEEELLDALAYATQARLERQEQDRRLVDALEQLKRTDDLRLAAEARAEKAEADLVSHVEAQDRRIAILKEELAATRFNLSRSQQALDAEQRARMELERQVHGGPG